MNNIRQKTIVAMLLTLLISPLAWAEVRKVTLYPSHAVVTENTKVKIMKDADSSKKVVFILPAEADPESLQTVLVAAKSLKIEQQKYKRIDISANPEADALRRRMKKLRDERISVKAAIEGHDAQIQFWHAQTKAKTKTLTDAVNLSAAIYRNMKKAWQDKLSLQPELERIDKSIKDLQAEIDQTAVTTTPKWEISAILTGRDNGKAELQYTYNLSGCGWQPAKRLNVSYDDKKNIHLREIEIWQSTDQDWRQINLAVTKSEISRESLKSNVCVFDKYDVPAGKRQVLRIN